MSIGGVFVVVLSTGDGGKAVGVAFVDTGLARCARLCFGRGMSDILNLTGRLLIAILFVGGAAQKIADPAPAADMIRSTGLPGELVWPVAAFNLVAAIGLIVGPAVRVWALALAVYCLFTSWFHWRLGADPWQMTIMVKNWAIAGGLCVLAAQGPGRFAYRWGGRGRTDHHR